MALFSKPKSPVDRALQQLERELATVRQQAQELEHQDTATDNGTQARTSSSRHRRPAPSMNNFVNQMLRPPEHHDTPSYRTTQVGFFDGGGGPDAIDSDAAVLTRDSDADLFAHAKAAEAKARQEEKEDPRLARYLSAGTFRNQKPLRHVERRARNRFIMWLGLSFTALWLVYLVIN